MAAPAGGSAASPPAAAAKPVRTGPIGARPQLNPPYSRPKRRNRAVVAAAVGLIAVVGVVAGLLATRGSSHVASPVAAYLTANVPAGTVVAVAGGGSRLSRSLPSGYPTVAVTASSLETAASARYLLTTDPVIAAGPALAAWVHGHARLLAVDTGVATLWRVVNLAPPAASTPAASTPSASTPTVTTPTVPPSGTPAPSSGSTVVPGGPSSVGVGSVVVSPGESFWSVAQSVLTQHLGTTPTPAQVGAYWAQLIAANANHLPVPGNPNLLYSGTTLVLPAVG